MTTEVLPEPELPAPTRAERLALRVLQAGAIVTALSVTIFRAFDLDRFFVPKELALHATATLAALLLIGAVTHAVRSRVDLLLAGYFILSALSAAMSTNRWAALRALSITASALVLFWIGRRLREAGLAERLLHGLALAVVIAAVTSLLQTYGLDLELFAQSRVPGGTLGNRNFIAHAAAFGFPLLLLATLGAVRRKGVIFAAAGIAMTTATLVLTRSRAAWLAFAVIVAVTILAMLLSPSLRRSGKTWGRFSIVLIAMAAGVTIVVSVPNALHWNSDNPYIETARRVTEFREGSGHGRLIQYQRSAVMALHHPLFGVGPGNWPVVYPKHAAKHDPSLDDAEAGKTSNPWPSSDWVASVSERGSFATALLALAFASLFLAGLRRLFNAPDVEDAIMSLALLGTIAGAVVTGLFDAVLLLAFPTIIVWPALGALASREDDAPRRNAWSLVAMAVLVIAIIGAARSAMQLAAMDLYSTRSDRTSLDRAAQLDPGNYRLQLRLSRVGKRQERCEHALAALSLFPHAAAAKNASRGCD